MSSIARPLDDPESVRNFFRDVLSIDVSKDEVLQQWAKTIGNIATYESENKKYSKPENSTMVSPKYRSEYTEDDKRWALRERIVKELYTKKRLVKDDNIDLGKGGAKPLTEIKKEKTAFIIIGPPASGKSGIANKLADLYGAYILDGDYAKRKFPEFRTIASGASLLHEESAAMILPNKKHSTPNGFQTLFQLCAKDGVNVVIPKIGNNHEKIYKLFDRLKNKLGYKVHLIGVSLDRRKATRRALDRLMTTERYVPLSLIFDAYGNEPILTYYRLKRIYEHEFESVGKISTDVPKGAKYEVIDNKNSPVMLLI